MSQRVTQRDRLLDLLRENAGQWVGLPRILDLRISQYGARVHELRKMGHNIENRTEHRDGQVHSWFRLSAPTGQVPLFTVGPEYEQRGHYLEVLGRRM